MALGTGRLDIAVLVVMSTAPADFSRSIYRDEINQSLWQDLCEICGLGMGCDHNF